MPKRLSHARVKLFLTKGFKEKGFLACRERRHKGLIVTRGEEIKVRHSCDLIVRADYSRLKFHENCAKRGEA